MPIPPATSLSPKARETIYDCGPSSYITHFRIIRGSDNPTWFVDSRTSDTSEAFYLATTYPDIDVFNATGPAVSDLIRKNQEWYNQLIHGFLTLNYTVRSDFWKGFDPIAMKEISVVDLGGKDPMVHPDSTIIETISAKFLSSPSHYKGIRTYLSEDFDNGQPIPSFSVAFLNYRGLSSGLDGYGYTPDKYANRMINEQVSVLQIISVSDEYDRYLKDVLVEKSDDWVKMFDRKNIYSNIDGAAGIFGAAAYCELIPVKEWFGLNWAKERLIF